MTVFNLHIPGLIVNSDSSICLSIYLDTYSPVVSMGGQGALDTQAAMLFPFQYTRQLIHRDVSSYERYK